jgi:hypothetical protein
MKGAASLFFALVFSMTNQQISSTTRAQAVPAHVSNTFQFVVPAPLSRAASLFGPEGERCWAGQSWNPVFVYPHPARDTEGAVFTIQHGPHKSVWVNTLFDLAAGRMQYVSFVPDMLVFTVDVRLTAVTPSTTSVEVTYARTALDVTANEHVLGLGMSDRESGPHWQQAIDSCLAGQ